MSTQVSFTTDKELKRQAMKKAKSEGVTLKAVLVQAMKGYVDGKMSFALVATEPEIEEINLNSPELQKAAQALTSTLKKNPTNSPLNDQLADV